MSYNTTCGSFDNTKEARSRGVQRHLAPIVALKSEGGHENYVTRRNLRGQ